MTSSAKAFAPGNISCIFKIHEDANPAKMGSLGLGFTVNKGVTVEVVFSSKTEVYFNKKKINFPTVKSVVKKLTLGLNKKIRINISSDLPLGSGFGLSGASALATAYALNNLLGLKYSNLELAKIAHIAEVENRTGLGDVVNQYFGGFLLKLRPSSEFKVKKIPLENIPVYCKYFSQLSTKAVLSDPKLKETINQSATEELKKIESYLLLLGEGQDEFLVSSNSHANKPHPSPLLRGEGIKSRISATVNFSALISISKEFAINSGLLTNKKVISMIKKIEAAGGHASMIMLGNSVFSDIPFTGSLELKISNTSAHLL